MQVLHLHWLPSSDKPEQTPLFVWAETAGAQQPKARRRKKTQPHPFIASVAALRQWLPRGHLLERAKERQLAIWLPSGKHGPHPSPGLIHNWTRDDAPPQLMQWHLQGPVLAPADAFQLLIALNGAGALPHHVKLGSDAAYWLTVTNFVVEMLAQQKYRPTLVEVSNGSTAKSGRTTSYEGRWRAVLDSEADAARLGLLSSAMPAFCRAIADDPERPPAARALLTDFVDTVLDAGVRQWARPAVPTRRTSASDGDGPVQRWLRALARDDAEVQANAAQLQHLYIGFRAWERMLHVAGTATYRVALRLEAPVQQKKTRRKPATDTWQLHYLLQARDDASLLVPADEVWKTRGSALKMLDRQFERPQETLLTGLGYAGRYFDPIQRSLKQAKPSSVTLTTQQAFDFLRHCAPQLQRSGFGLLTPPWWNKPGTRLGVQLKLAKKSQKGAETSSTGHMALQNLIHYRWQLSLGDTALTREEFDALVRLKSPLVQIRGQWVQLDPEQIEAAIRFYENQALEGDVSMLEALGMGLVDGGGQHAGLSVDGVEFDAWLQEWLGQMQGDEKMAELPAPQGLRATLRPYQRFGYSWLDFARRSGTGVILADDMGLGKTIQTLSFVQRRKEVQGKLDTPFLLIAPTSVVANWAREVEKFTPDLKPLIHQGSDRLQGDEFVRNLSNVDMVLTSYAIARRDGDLLRTVEWQGLVLDEAQNIKNASSKQAQLIRQLPADFRVALTGTPVENRLSELWSIMHFLNPGYLGSQKAFRSDYAIPIERHHDTAATERLRRLTRPFILRRVKTDPTVIQDLPDKQEVKEFCTLSEEQATLYEAVVREAMEAIQDESDEGSLKRRGLILSMLMKLKQVCNHPAQFLHQGEGYAPAEDDGRSGKQRRLFEMLEEVLAANDRTLIFTQFSEMGNMLKTSVQERFGVETLFLHGGTPAKKRAEMVTRFQEQPDGPPIFVLSIKAGGTGLNLTRANHVFHFDRWWNPAVENQATDRAFRIGQTKNVLVHKFVCLGTLEERIDAMIEAKKALAESVVGSGENWLTELSTSDLRELVALRKS